MESVPVVSVKAVSVGICFIVAGRKAAGEGRISPSRFVGGMISVPVNDVESSEASWLPEISRKGMGRGVDFSEAVSEVVLRSRSASHEY